MSSCKTVLLFSVFAGLVCWVYLQHVCVVFAVHLPVYISFIYLHAFFGSCIMLSSLGQHREAREKQSDCVLRCVFFLSASENSLYLNEFCYCMFLLPSFLHVEQFTLLLLRQIVYKSRWDAVRVMLSHTPSCQH